ncbi:unnamed protein product, partial [Sphacelaria rigidula]
MRFVLTPPGGAPLKNEPPQLGSLVTLVFSVALYDRDWPLQDVVLDRLAFEEEEGIKPPMQESSLGNLQAYSYLFGLDKRCLTDGHLHKLVRENGINQAVMTYCQVLKPLHLANDVASTFISGAHMDRGHHSQLDETGRILRVSLRVATDDKEDADKITSWRWHQLQFDFATAPATWIHEQESRKAIQSYTYTATNPNASDGAKEATGNVFDWLDAAYHRVFKDALSGAKSTTSATAQGRIQKKNPRHSNKNSFTMGMREVPYGSAWAHPYIFDSITMYEFMTDTPQGAKDTTKAA